MRSTSRAENLSFEILQKHFDVPMTEAAKRFGVCLTFFKKICRSHGIKRWPFRKLKSLQSKISDLQTRLQDKPSAPESQLQRRLDELRDIDNQTAILANTLGDGPSDSQPRSEDNSEAQPCSSEEKLEFVEDAPKFTGARQAQLVSYAEIRKSFNLPMMEAAKRFGVSLTLFKKICRKNGIGRWPHRKLKSLKSKIGDLQLRLQGTQGTREGELKRRLNELRGSEQEPDEEATVFEQECNVSYEEGHSSPHGSSTEEEEEQEVGALCLAMLSGGRYSEGCDGTSRAPEGTIASVTSADSQYSF